MARKYLGSGVTNSDGVASFNYTGKGLGKIQVVAESGELVSTSYDLYDVLYKDLGGSSHNDTNWSSTTVNSDYTTDPTCTILSMISTSTFSTRYNNIASYTNRPLTIEFDMSTTYDSADQYGLGVSLRENASSTGGASWSMGQIGISSDSGWHHIKITLDTTTASLQVDNDTPVSRDITVVPNRFYFTFNTGANNPVTKYRNFIIY